MTVTTQSKSGTTPAPEIPSGSSSDDEATPKEDPSKRKTLSEDDHTPTLNQPDPGSGLMSKEIMIVRASDPHETDSPPSSAAKECGNNGEYMELIGSPVADNENKK